MASNNRTNRASNGARTRGAGGGSGSGGGARAGSGAGASSSDQASRRPARQRPRPESKERPKDRPSARTARRDTGNRPGGGGDRRTRVLAGITANPIPALMIGAGLTWMLLGERIGSALDAGVVRRGRRAIGELGETFGESFSSAAQGTASTMRDGLVTMREYAQEGLGTAGETIRQGAAAVGAVGRGAKRAVSSTADALSDTWENHPLAVCAAALATGVTLGMLLPSTRRESRTMGQASAALAKQARRTGTRVLKQGKRIASEAVEVAGREARRQGLTATDLGAKVKRVASKARDAVASE
jgi:hypothetical protein